MRAAEIPFAKDAPRPERYFGLHYVVPRTEGVTLRIQERQNSLFLIPVKQGPGERHRRQNCSNYQSKFPGPDTRQKEDHTGRHREHDGCTKIGLAEHQHNRRRNEEQWYNQKGRTPDFLKRGAVERNEPRRGRG